MEKESSIIFTETTEGARTYDLMPRYSREGIRYIYWAIFNNQPKIIADIGSGTGRLTAQLLYDNLVDCPSMLIRRDVLEKAGYFDEILKALEDYDLALRLARLAPAAFVNEILLDSSYSTSGVSGSAVNYLTASCVLLGKYKKDYLETDNFNRRVEIILSDAERTGIKEQIISFLEKVLTGASS